MTSEASSASLTRRVGVGDLVEGERSGGLGDGVGVAEVAVEEHLDDAAPPGGGDGDVLEHESAAGEGLLQGGADAVRCGHADPPSLQFVGRRVSRRPPL